MSGDELPEGTKEIYKMIERGFPLKEIENRYCKRLFWRAISRLEKRGIIKVKEDGYAEIK